MIPDMDMDMDIGEGTISFTVSSNTYRIQSVPDHKISCN